MAEPGTLHDAFIDELRDTYDAEKQLTKALPKMAKAASSPELRERVRDRTWRRPRARSSGSKRSSARSTRRSAASTATASPASSKKASAMMEEDFDEATMDACLIAAGQRAEHYEMAAYGTLVAWARAMGHTEAADLLQQTLDEEKAADEKLTALAESASTRRPRTTAHPDEEDEDDEEEMAMAAPSSKKSAPAAAAKRKGARRYRYRQTAALSLGHVSRR